jgi:GNAT superfamily N-acetyltransferase
MANIISTTFDQLNLDDPFFDSLKSMYRNFSTWFRNKAEEHASCDVVYDAEGNLKAMLYTKIEGKYEDYSRMEKPFAPSVRLKIGTLKSELRGEGIGKRFLEMAVERARQDPGISAVYATLFADKPELSGLVKMFESYYFSRRCLLCNGETVFEYPITWWRTPKQED